MDATRVRRATSPWFEDELRGGAQGGPGWRGHGLCAGASVVTDMDQRRRRKWNSSTAPCSLSTDRTYAASAKEVPPLLFVMFRSSSSDIDEYAADSDDDA